MDRPLRTIIFGDGPAVGDGGARRVPAGPWQKANLAPLYREWDASRPRTLDLCADLWFTKDLLTGAGFDVLVADQTALERAGPFP